MLDTINGLFSPLHHQEIHQVGPKGHGNILFSQDDDLFFGSISPLESGGVGIPRIEVQLKRIESPASNGCLHSAERPEQ